MFSSVIRQFISGIFYLWHPHTHTHINPYIHTQTHWKTHVSLCTKPLTVTARLPNDQCVYMKSYHWAVCSTDKGHVIFFLFWCLNFGWKEMRMFWFLTHIWGFSWMEAYCILTEKNTSCFVIVIIPFWHYIEIFSLLLRNKFFWGYNKIIPLFFLLQQNILLK